MLSKLYKYTPIKSLKFPIEKYRDEFEDVRMLTNLQRCEKIGIVLLLLNITLILVDLFIFKPMRAEAIGYLYLFYAHIVMLISMPLWFVLLKLHRKYGNLLSSKFLFHAFLCISIFWCSFIALNDLHLSNQISVYFICILAVSTCFYIEPLERFLVIFTSLLVFIMGIIFIVSNAKELNNHIINSSAVVIVSFVISHLGYKSFLNNFIYKKELLESKIELMAANEKLKEHERLRTDFFTNISHELKTPLNVIYCAQQIMESNLKQDEENSTMSKYLNMIKQNSFRLIRLISNLIDLTKLDAVSLEVKFTNADIVQVVEDITMSVVPFVENKGLSIIFDTTIEEKLISCDPDKIERIVLNLLSNALKFTKNGGSIFVNIYLEDNKVCISVKDTGIGIPDDMKDLIFDRFTQVDNSTSKKQEGSGIGLALVKSLVDMHDGNICVNSTLGEGSEFIIMLPDTKLPEHEIAEALPTIEEDNIKRISIEFSDIYH